MPRSASECLGVPRSASDCARVSPAVLFEAMPPAIHSTSVVHSQHARVSPAVLFEAMPPAPATRSTTGHKHRTPTMTPTWPPPVPATARPRRRYLSASVVHSQHKRRPFTARPRRSLSVTQSVVHSSLRAMLDYGRSSTRVSPRCEHPFAACARCKGAPRAAPAPRRAPRRYARLP